MEEYKLRPGARARELLEGFLVEYGLAPGDHLPSERALSQRWGLSRSRFDSEVEELYDYARTRPRRLLEFFQDSMGLSDDQMRHYFGDAGAAIRAYEATQGSA